MAKKGLDPRERFAIELSFALGIPVFEIDRWPQSEIERYAAYAQEATLPARRQEIYMAQSAFVAATAFGGYKGKLTDFLLDGQAEDDRPPEAMDGGKLFEGFSPV